MALPLLLASCASEFEAPEVGETVESLWFDNPTLVTPVMANGEDTREPQDTEYAYSVDPYLIGQKGLLVVYLHGKNGSPDKGAAFMGQANALGFYVLGVDYSDLGTLPGTNSVAEICMGQGSACPGQVEEAMFEGTVGGPITVPKMTSVKSRLNSLLHYMAATDSNHNWSQFLVDDHPAWGKIVLAGHSEGATQSAWGAKYYPVRRVVMMSDPGGASDWIKLPLRPTGANAYGLVDAWDTVVDAVGVLHAWTTMGMQGTYNFDALPNPSCGLFGQQYCDAHQLITYQATGDRHAATVEDTKYAPAWIYMLSHNL